MNDNIFILNERLKTCALMVRDNSRFADIGTDHAYLPIWLLKNNIIISAIAADIKEGPLKIAKSNIAKHNLEDKIETRLSNGLEKINKDEVDDIAIAGMGGELIAEILSKALWLKDEKKNIILQPMSMAKELRLFLAKENFKIIEERAIISDKRPYTVIRASYTKEKLDNDELYPYIGLLQTPLSEPGKKYVEKELNHLKNKIKGLTIIKNFEEAEALKIIYAKIEELIK